MFSSILIFFLLLGFQIPSGFQILGGLVDLCLGKWSDGGR